MKMFSVDDASLEKVKDWIASHDKTHIRAEQRVRYAGAIGGEYTWCFTPTSLGDVCKVKCSCGETLDVTDYENW